VIELHVAVQHAQAAAEKAISKVELMELGKSVGVVGSLLDSVADLESVLQKYETTPMIQPFFKLMNALNRVVRNTAMLPEPKFQVCIVVADILRWMALLWFKKDKLYRVHYIAPVISCIVHGYQLGSLKLAQKFFAVAIVLVQVDLVENGPYYQTLLEQSIRVGLSHPKLQLDLDMLVTEYAANDPDGSIIFTAMSAALYSEANSVREYAVKWLAARIKAKTPLGTPDGGGGIIPREAAYLCLGLQYAVAQSSGDLLTIITDLIQLVAESEEEPNVYVVQLILLLASDNVSITLPRRRKACSPVPDPVPASLAAGRLPASRSVEDPRELERRSSSCCPTCLHASGRRGYGDHHRRTAYGRDPLHLKSLYRSGR